MSWKHELDPFNLPSGGGKPSRADRLWTARRRELEARARDGERILVPYRLPDGRIVQVDDSAAKGAIVIDFTLEDGRIVPATRL